MKRFLAITIVSALAVASTMSSPASARDDGAVAAAAIGGLAVGAIICSQAAPPPRAYYGGPAYVDQPVVYERREIYRECHTEREQVVDQYGYMRTRKIRVCD